MRRDPTGVWLRRRPGKGGTVRYGLRWVDPLTGQVRSESCGTDLAYARDRRQQIRQDLRDGLSGKLPVVSLPDFRERLDALMAGKSPATIRKTREALAVVNVTGAGELTKTRKNRTLPMHPEAKAVLTELWAQVPKVLADGQVAPKWPHVFTWPDGKPFEPDWVTHEFAQVVKRAGVDKYTVKDLGGWSVVSVVEKHYTGDVSDVHRRAMARIAAATA